MFEQLPNPLAGMLEGIHTENEKKIINEAFSRGRNFTALRVNRLLTSPLDVEEELMEHRVAFQKIPWLQDGYILPEVKADALWHLPTYKNGEIYLQGFSSQLVGEILAPYLQKDSKVLDIAAAPGGKTSHLSAILQNQGSIVACEINRIRYEKLLHTLTKQGCLNVEALHLDAMKVSKTFPTGLFDVILADVPCSASGKILYSQEKSFGYFHTPGIDQKNALTQQSLLSGIVPLLKPGGVLLYSTCTISPLENEGMVDYLLRTFPHLHTRDINKHFESRELQKLLKAPLTHYQDHTYHQDISRAIRILPSTLMEGFFICLLQAS